MNGAANPEANYQAVQQVVAEKKYTVLEKSDETRTLKVRTHIDETSSSKVSTITLSVAPDGKVSLVPGGFLVRPDGTIHKRLDEELTDLEKSLSEKLAATAGDTSVATAQGAPTPASASASASSSGDSGSATPTAWLEPAADPARWGPGNFTCLPIHIPTEESTQIALRLSTGELASVTLSLAYDAALCRSQAACALPEGCPALGIGDTQQVQALAERINAKQLTTTATLLYKGQPAVVIDLGQHGSVSQALGQTAGTAAPANGSAP